MFRIRRTKSFDKLRDVFRTRKPNNDEEEGNINEMVSIDDESPIAFSDQLTADCHPSHSSHFADNSNGRLNRFIRSFRKKMRGSRKKSDKVCSVDSEKCSNLIEEFDQLTDDETKAVFANSGNSAVNGCGTDSETVGDYMITSLQETSNDDNKSVPNNSCFNPSHNVYETPSTPASAGVNVSLTQELAKLAKYGWYWGPISRSEAEEKLSGHGDGAFLVRDSSDDHYLLSLSFRSYGRTFHTRIEHTNGLFSFYSQPEHEAYTSVVMLIEESIKRSHEGVFCYSRGRSPGSPSFPVRLTKPVSRFTQVRSLQYLCRFLIRQYTRVDHIQKLPLPPRIKGYLEEGHY